MIVLTIMWSAMISVGCPRSFYPSGVKVILSDSLEFVLTAYYEINKLYIIRKNSEGRLTILGHLDNANAK